MVWGASVWRVSIRRDVDGRMALFLVKIERTGGASGRRRSGMSTKTIPEDVGCIGEHSMASKRPDCLIDGRVGSMRTKSRSRT